MNKLSLNFKVGLSLALALVSALVIAALGLRGMGELNQSISNIVDKTVPRVQNAYQTRGELRQLAIFQTNFILEDTPEGMRQLGEAIAQQNENFRKTLARGRADASEQNAPRWDSLASIYDKWWEKALAVQKAALAGDDKGATALIRECATIRKEAEAILMALVERNDQVLADEEKATAELFARTRNITILVSVLAMVVASLIAFTVMRATSRAINVVVQNLSEGSLQVTTAAQQIAASSEQLSQSTTEQAASLEETAASIEEINSMVSKNSDNSRSAASTSSQSQAKATHGKQVVEKMIQSMADINRSNTTIMEQVNRSNESMTGIVQVIEEIGNKTKVINDIVFQTKLLSFNASVEAARAGEHGKGFAVVAEEVGNLAQMSGNAAKDITVLLEESVQKVRQIVEETKSSVGNIIAEGKVTVENGALVARECGEVLEEIVQNVSSVSTMSGEIASASEEQSKGLVEITNAMGQLDQMTQQNAATSEECAAAAEELSAQSHHLKAAVSQLISTIHGAKDGSTEEAFATGPSSNEKLKTAHKTTAAKVLHLKPKVKTPAPMAAAPQAKAVGESPSFDDPRFKD